MVNFIEPFQYSSSIQKVSFCSSSEALTSYWGGYWANTCCSHPRQGETVAFAALRRLKEEVGLDASLKQIFSFEYHARFKELGSEHELCHVLLGKQMLPPTPM